MRELLGGVRVVARLERRVTPGLHFLRLETRGHVSAAKLVILP